MSHTHTHTLSLSLSPDDNQKLIVEYGGLNVLVPLLRGSDTETVTAAVAALRNLSIHNGNEVRATALYYICTVVAAALVVVYMARMTYLLTQQTSNQFLCALGRKQN